MDAGNLKEFAEPFGLLRCKGSILYSLVQQTGHDEAQRLFEMSIKAHCARHAKESVTGNLGDCEGGCGCRGGVCPPYPISSPVIRVGNVDDATFNGSGEKVDMMAPMADTQHVDDGDVDNMASQHNDVSHDEYNDDDVTHIDTKSLLPTTEL